MVSGMRVGELSRRVGVSTDVLRVWERRHHLFTPERTPGGYRVYSAEDERRAHEVLALKAQGVPLADAVASVLASGVARAQTSPEVLRAALGEAVAELDVAAASAAVRRATEELGVEAAMTSVLLPYLKLLGELWEDGTLTVAHEHFASHTIRRHIGSLAPELPTTGRRVGVVACVPGDMHDIGALMVAVVLARRGWSVRFLGGDTPIAAVQAVADQLRADRVVLAMSRPDLMDRNLQDLQRLAASHPIAVGGAGAVPDAVRALGAMTLPNDPVLAAAELDVATDSGRIVATTV